MRLLLLFLGASRCASLASMVAGVALGGAGCAAEQASDPLDLQPAPDARGDRGPSKPPIQLDMPSRGADLPTDPTTNAPAAAAAATGCPVDLAGAILCDSFEASALRGAWVPLTMGGSVHLGNKHVLTGAQSLGVSFGTLPSSGRAGLELRSPAIAGAARVALRMHVRLPTDGYPNDLPIGGLFDAGGNGVAFVVHQGKTLTIDDTTGASARSLATFQLTLAQWACMVIDIDRGAGEVRVALDGATRVVSIARGAVIDRARVGMTYEGAPNANASVGFDIDDVAITSAALACPGQSQPMAPFAMTTSS